MTKRLTTILCCLASMAAVVSCKKDATTDSSQSSILGEISFLSTITKATDSSFEAGDQISVVAYDGDVIYGTANTLYTFGGEQQFTSSSPISTTGESLSYLAIYPYTTISDQSVIFSARSDQSSGTNYTLSDLMMGSTEATTSITPHLEFEHMMTKFIVNVSSEEFTLSDLSVRIDAVADVEYDLSTKSPVAGTTPQTITMASNGDGSFKAIFAPQTIAADAFSGEISSGDSLYTFDLGVTSSVTFEAGKVYTLDAKITRDDLGEGVVVVDFKGEISSWVDGELFETEDEEESEEEEENEPEPEPEGYVEPLNNLIVDYGFDMELGSGGWSGVQMASNISIVDASDTMNSFGENAMRMTVSGSSNTQAISTGFSVTAGESYTVRFSVVYYPDDGGVTIGSGGQFLTFNMMSGIQSGTGGSNQTTYGDGYDNSHQRVYDYDVSAVGEGVIIDKEFLFVPASGITSITPKFVLTAGTAYIDNVSIVEGDETEFKILSFGLEGVEIEDAVEYLQLIATHNGDSSTTLSYSIVEGNGEIRWYSGDKGEFYYFAPAVDPTSTTTIEVVASRSDGSSCSATYTYQSIRFTYDNYYLVEELWEEVHLPLFTGTTYIAFDFHENDPELPNVLLIGTSISIGYTNPTQVRMKNINNDGTADVANVYRIPQNSNSTEVGVANLDFWLDGLGGEEAIWDVIHVNFGHHDFKQSTSGYSVSVEDYQANLEIIFEKLLERSKRVIWANTTYYTKGGSYSGSNYRDPADWEPYNDAAEAARAKFPEITLDDQYALTSANTDWVTDGVHFSTTGYAALAEQVCGHLKTALGL